ncbi:hypothetical protein DFH27DRAFT_555032 [Peziza echinospora]|nr:hypothetical protein DFH27DRAFT_555032 [Peziza echinospora]
MVHLLVMRMVEIVLLLLLLIQPRVQPICVGHSGGSCLSQHASQYNLFSFFFVFFLFFFVVCFFRCCCYNSLVAGRAAQVLQTTNSSFAMQASSSGREKSTASGSGSTRAPRDRLSAGVVYGGRWVVILVVEWCKEDVLGWVYAVLCAV